MAKITKSMQMKLLKKLAKNESTIPLDVDGETIEVIVKKRIPYAEFCEAVHTLVRIIGGDDEETTYRPERIEMAEWFVWLAYFTNIDTELKDKDGAVEKDVERLWSLRQIEALTNAWYDDRYAYDFGSVHEAADEILTKYRYKKPGSIALEMLDELFNDMKSQFAKLDGEAVAEWLKSFAETEAAEE